MLAFNAFTFTKYLILIIELSHCYIKFGHADDTKRYGLNWNF